MKYCIDSYLCNHKQIPNITQEHVKAHPEMEVKNQFLDDGPSYMVSWGNDVKNIPGTDIQGDGLVIESGFLWSGYHIDHALYEDSSINTEEFHKRAAAFKAPVPAKTLIDNAKYPKSKFAQPNVDAPWRGVVLACQNPGDRSIRRVGTPEDYYNFVEGACQAYGRDLFVKLHPWNSGPAAQRLIAIAKKYGCSVGKVNLSVIKHCKFVIMYNSTFAFDCFVNSVPVVNYERGYFHNAPCVHFSNRTYPQLADTDIDSGIKLADFAIWNYMFNKDMLFDKWVQMFKYASASTDLMILDPELSYANSLLGKIPLNPPLKR